MSNTRESIGDQATVDGLINRTLTSLEEDGATALGAHALRENNALTSVKFTNLLSGGNYSMKGCTALTGISSADMPALATLGNYMFDGCSALESVSLPEATSAGTYAFQNCKALESVSLPKLATFSNYIFAGCYSLKTVSAAALKAINQYAFQNCRKLKTIDLSEVTTVGNYAFDTTGLTKLVLPKATSLGTYTGKGGVTGLIDLTNNISISSNKFNGANALAHLILRSTTLCALGNSNALTGTPLANGIGWIYVPEGLVDTYKAASNWSARASQIVKLSEYPKALQCDTISDTWAQIIANANYSTDYSIGDIKSVDIGGASVPMQIAAFDEDGSKITWISVGLFGVMPMNPASSTAGGWEDCDLRAWLQDDVYPQIESTVKNAITAVDKTYYDFGTSSTKTVSDTLWIPSAREIYGGSSYESSGAVYDGLFTSNSARIKKLGISGAAGYWWLRSANSSANFRCVNVNGVVNVNYASNTYGVALGFCT